MNLYREKRTPRDAANPKVEFFKRLLQSLSVDIRVARRAKDESPAEKRVLDKGTHGDIEDKKLCNPLLKTIEKSDISEFIENVNNDHHQDTVSYIPFLVKQSMTTILVRGLASNGPYSIISLSVDDEGTPRQLGKKLVVLNGISNYPPKNGRGCSYLFLMCNEGGKSCCVLSRCYSSCG